MTVMPLEWVLGRDILSPPMILIIKINFYGISYVCYGGSLEAVSSQVTVQPN